MRLFKLTDQDWQTFNETKWGPGIEHTAPGGKLCSNAVLHAYIDPHLAILLNPVHGRIADPVLWEADGDVCTRDPLKVGCTRLQTIRILDAPLIPLDQRVKFAALCAAQRPQPVEWLIWARDYFLGQICLHDSVKLCRALTRPSSIAPDPSEYAIRSARAAIAIIIDKAPRYAAWAATRISRAAKEANAKPIDFVKIVNMVFHEGEHDV